MFHEEPYKNRGVNIRQRYCHADHFDDVMYIFGFCFIEGGEFIDGRYLSEEEKLLSKRMMKGMNQLL